MKSIRFLTFSFICFLPYFSHSQKYSLKEAEDVWDDYLHQQFFLPATGQSLLFNYASPHSGFSYNRKTDNTTATAYDSKMRKKYSVDVKELSGKKYQTSISNGSGLFVFYSDKEGTVFKCQLDPSNGTTASTQQVFSFQGDKTEFFTGVSADSSHYFVLCKSSMGTSASQDYTGAVLDKQMNVVRKFSTTSNDERWSIIANSYLLGNDGTLFITSTVNVKTEKGSYYPLEQQVKQITTDGNTSTSIVTGVPEGRFSNVSWALDGNNITFNGLLAKSKKSDFTSIVWGKFDVTGKKVTNVKEIQLSQVFYLQNSTNSLVKDIVTDGIPADVALIGSFINSDKSTYIIVEQTNRQDHSLGHYYAAGGAFGTASQFGGTNHFNNNVYIVKLTPAGEVAWLKVVAKKQVQSETEVCSSVAVIKDGKDGLHVFFNDNSRNTDAEPNKKVSMATLDPNMKNTSLACSYITSEGNMTKTILQNNDDADHFFSPENYLPVGDNKILYTSYRVRSMGKSTFRLGSLNIQ
jgi:hypothetical protein